MGVTKLTALIIQSWPDTVSMEKGGIYVTAGRRKDVKWSGLIYLVEKDGVDRLLLSTEPFFETKVEATVDMKRLVEKIRNLLLDA